MSDDRRNKKMVAVINCVLNHNVRAEGAAMYPGINHDVVDVLRKYDAGVSIRDVLDTPDG